MGLATPMPPVGTSLVIDVGTLIYHKGIKRGFKRKKIDRKKLDKSKVQVSNLDSNVIIPVYNEEVMIRECIESAFGQTVPPKFVIVVDDCSQDSTADICKELEKKHNNLVYVRMDKNHGKAHNINRVVDKLVGEFYAPITLTIDGDVMLRPNFIELIRKPFVDENVVAVSGVAIPFEDDPIKPWSFMSKIIARTYKFLFNYYSFSKLAQSLRGAVTPVCGGCVAYRTDILKSIPIPGRTKTEDTDHTWLLQEHGHRVVHLPKAKIDSEEAKTLSGFFNQWFRWYSGTIQCLYVHGRKLNKAKRLLYSTVIPANIDAWVYTTFLLATIALFFIDPLFAASALFFDLCVTGVVMAIFSRRELKNLPLIWLMKFPISLAWIAAGLKTTWEYITHKQHLWKNRWERQSNL